MFHRLCFITKINEHEIKNVESDYSTWMNNIVNNDEDGDLVPGHNDDALQYGGAAIILGPWIIHCLEAEDVLMQRFFKKLREKQNNEISYFKETYVIHYTEDITDRAFLLWACKSILTKDATAEIKTLDDFEKVSYLYKNMVKLGTDTKDYEQKGEKEIIKQMVSIAKGSIPCGDELASVVSDQIMTLEEWFHFVEMTPEINLEKEHQWPADPDLIY